MTEKTAQQITRMKEQTIGVEVEMNHITRKAAAKLAAEFFGTNRTNYHAVFSKGTIEYRCFEFERPTADRKNGLHAGRLKTFIQLALALSEMAKTVKNASPKPQQHDNPKFAMRTWLIRLGMVGEEFSTARAVLTKNLDGNNAFRFGRP